MDGRLSSSSFPRQGWPRLSPSYAPPAVQTPREYQSTTTERETQHRTQREEPPNSGPASSSSSRKPKAATQPVLVRAYSGDAEQNKAKDKDSTPKMSPRRLLPFTTGSKGSASSSRAPPGPPRPSDFDFSIESILQAIDPEIRGTLDSIAEICGRSKLSLSNEYDSHIAPLGEIRAASGGGLVPVEEVSSSAERHADEGGMVTFDDEHAAAARANPGRELHPFSFYGYVESLRQSAAAHAQSEVRRSIDAQLSATPGMGLPSLPVTREFASKPKNSSKDLLAKHPEHEGHQTQVTPAVVSEVYLDAQADDAGSANNGPHVPVAAGTPAAKDGPSGPEVVRSLLGWLRWSARFAGPDLSPRLQSAEGKLRAMLADENPSLLA
ncbi:hypothetical protein N7474_000271 [Penicillium riverlandense]|uniref:uncharacterized protein n=1 Tax=Penicillium riverlandense TaxID=1903569 RepID=UPI0025466D2C|nr:uncharacterized protein N7474_000271 [Penicillium riverlandense]KAJ5831960.1 hypothetical protein N7474_000271 [Penicillium riverlandense]